MLVLLEIGCVVVAYFFYDKIVGVMTSALAAALNSSYDSTWTATNTSTNYDYTPGGLVSKGIDAVQIEV